MAKLVEIIGVTHNPNYPRRFANPGEEDPAIATIREGFEQMRQKMTAARPDVLLCVGNDHLNQLFMHNMPAFMIGKAPHTQGPPKWEQDMGIPPLPTVSINQDFAKGIVRSGFDHGVDFAFSDELNIDHAITMPYHYVSPSQDLPIVPLLTNVMSHPMPPAMRCFQVGEALRAIIDEWPGDMRVGVLASGHLAVEIGGPKGRGRSPDPDFDAASVEAIGAGDTEGLMRLATFERMAQAGNFTPGFLNFVMLTGIAQGKAASQADLISCTGTNPAPFLTWDFYQEGVQ